METRSSMFRTFGAPSGRSMLTSFTIHVVVVCLMTLVGRQMLLQSAPTKKERALDIVFYHPPQVPVHTPAVPLTAPRNAIAGGAPAGAPAPALKPKPNAAPGPDIPGKPPELPPGPEVGYKTEPAQ